MEATATPLSGVLLVQPKLWRDARGYFFESYNEAIMRGLGIPGPFVQDNHSHSKKNVLRGLHYQIQNAQGKLVRVVSGEVFDVAVDLRRNSGTFGRWFGARLSAENCQMLWVPAGFAHGYLVLSDEADFLYKTTAFYSPAQERTILWNDPQLAIDWPLNGEPIVSDKDRQGTAFRDAEVFSA